MVLWPFLLPVTDIGLGKVFSLRTYTLLYDDHFRHLFLVIDLVSLCSTYNHIQEFIHRLHGRTTRSESIDSRHGKSATDNQHTVSFLNVINVLLSLESISLAYLHFSHRFLIFFAGR